MSRNVFLKRYWRCVSLLDSSAPVTVTPPSSSLFLLIGAVAAAAAGSTSLIFNDSDRPPVECHSSGSSTCSQRREKLTAFKESLRVINKEQQQQQQRVLPEFTSQQVQEQTTPTNVLMTYSGFVYNVTEFIPLHPGGTERISRAAGKAMEPYWQLHQQHFDTLEPLELLHGMIVGTLKQEDQTAIDDQIEDLMDQLDRFRLQVTVVLRTTTPFYFWSSYFLSQPLSYSLDDLQTLFPKTDRISQVGCPASSQRGQSTTRLFAGVLLKDLLRTMNTRDIQRIVFRAMDGEKAIVHVNTDEDWHNILLAYEEDGAPLTQQRGFPLRVIVSKDRVIKWVERIEVS